MLNPLRKTATGEEPAALVAQGRKASNRLFWPAKLDVCAVKKCITPAAESIE